MLERLLPHNLGMLDRVVRVVLGLALLTLVFFGPKTAWGWLGAVLLVTAVLGSCPLYTLLGLRTTGKQAASQS